MNRILEMIDHAPAHIPDNLKPIVRPFEPIYTTFEKFVYRVLPEREVKTPWGPIILVNPTNYVERRLAQGSFESRTVAYFVERVEQSSEIFADIGANIGFFSILYNQVSCENAQVHAFEPLERNRYRMEKNIELNGGCNIEIYPFGISDRSGIDEIWFSEERPGEASLTSKLYSAQSNYSTEIELRRLDDVYDDNNVPGFLKIDVEGAEVDVLRGGQDLLSNFKPEILMEIHQPLLEEFGDSVQTLISLLEDAGYSSAYHIESGVSIELGEVADVTDGSQHFHFL